MVDFMQAKITWTAPLKNTAILEGKHPKETFTGLVPMERREQAPRNLGELDKAELVLSAPGSHPSN